MILEKGVDFVGRCVLLRDNSVHSHGSGFHRTRVRVLVRVLRQRRRREALILVLVCFLCSSSHCDKCD